MSPANDEILYRVTRRPLLAIVVGGWGNKLPRRFRRRGAQLHIGRKLHCTEESVTMNGWRVQHIVREGGREEWRAYGPLRADEEEAIRDAEYASMRGALDVHPSNLPTVIDVLETELTAEQERAERAERERDAALARVQELEAALREIVAIQSRASCPKAGPAEKAARKSGTSKLDEATTQAVFELQRALRAVKVLERVDERTLSPARLEDHRRRLNIAKWNLREVRCGLDRLLEEDA